MTYVPFARQSVGGEFRGYSSERVLNWHARAWPSAASGEIMLAPCEGLTRRKNIGVGEVYAMLELGVFLYIAAGGKLWRLNFNTNALLDLGTIAADPATTIATTGTDIAVAAGGDLYVWQTDTDTFSQPNTGAFQDVGSVAAGDGFFVVTEAKGKRFSYSALNDATTWNALDFFTAEAMPDRIKRGLRAFQQFWMFGERSTEIWDVVGGSDVMARAPGGVIDRGIFWPQSACAMADAVYWVDHNRVVQRAAGITPQRISTPGLEALLKSYGADDGLAFFAYSQDGSEFYVVRFPDRPAWVFDVATGLWHERNTGTDEGPWIARCATRWQDVTAVGTSTGIVADLGGLTDDGATLVREAIGTPFNVGSEWVTMRSVEAAFRTGDTDLGREAKVTLEVRKRTHRDWRTWGAAKERGLGVIGEDKTAEWHALGRAKGFQFRLRVTDPVKTALYGVAYDPAR